LVLELDFGGYLAKRNKDVAKEGQLNSLSKKEKRKEVKRENEGGRVS